MCVSLSVYMCIYEWAKQKCAFCWNLKLCFRGDLYKTEWHFYISIRFINVEQVMPLEGQKGLILSKNRGVDISLLTSYYSITSEIWNPVTLLWLFCCELSPAKILPCSSGHRSDTESLVAFSYRKWPCSVICPWEVSLVLISSDYKNIFL